MIDSLWYIRTRGKDNEYVFEKTTHYTRTRQIFEAFVDCHEKPFLPYELEELPFGGCLTIRTQIQDAKRDVPQDVLYVSRHEAKITNEYICEFYDAIFSLGKIISHIDEDFSGWERSAQFTESQSVFAQIGPLQKLYSSWLWFNYNRRISQLPETKDF